MSRCNYCNVEILDNTDVCPLCHGVLKTSGETDVEIQETYPDVYGKSRRFTFILRIFFAVWLISSIILGVINIQLGLRPLWFIVVSASAAYVLYIVRLMSDHESGYLKRIFAAVFLGGLLTLVIDYIFGFYRWSVNYVLPGTLLLINLILMILIFVNRRNWSSYIILQLLSVFLGIIPLILERVGVITNPILPEIAFISSILLFLGTLIIGGRTALNELKRRFHI